ncbi:exonuclease [Kaustia mangrovi]|uniref:Exonuclease n=1 Tax=Kaustia mangrovi TaxID=2593653 RepID=A0A7S8C1I1_9HYPH|nr:exonuclease [Kaustia mangrovi]QPC41660.1 exonuclease [Kaustia mangrovi]
MEAYRQRGEPTFADATCTFDRIKAVREAIKMTCVKQKSGDQLASLPAQCDYRDHDVDSRVDAYFSADVETDGPIPGPFSMLSFALVYAGSFDGKRFVRPKEYTEIFYREMRPISNDFQEEALRVNGLDRVYLSGAGGHPDIVMNEASNWIKHVSGHANPVLVAYPLSFDWTWIYWYFIKFCDDGSPFEYSRCFDIKTALAVKAGIPISKAGRSRLPPALISNHKHTHHAVDDAIAQAEIFANIFEWEGGNEGTQGSSFKNPSSDDRSSGEIS